MVGRPTPDAPESPGRDRHLALSLEQVALHRKGRERPYRLADRAITWADRAITT